MMSARAGEVRRDEHAVRAGLPGHADARERGREQRSAVARRLHPPTPRARRPAGRAAATPRSRRPGSRGPRCGRGRPWACHPRRVVEPVRARELERVPAGHGGQRGAAPQRAHAGAAALDVDLGHHGVGERGLRRLAGSRGRRGDTARNSDRSTHAGSTTATTESAGHTAPLSMGLRGELTGSRRETALRPHTRSIRPGRLGSPVPLRRSEEIRRAELYRVGCRRTHGGARERRVCRSGTRTSRRDAARRRRSPMATARRAHAPRDRRSRPGRRPSRGPGPPTPTPAGEVAQVDDDRTDRRGLRLDAALASRTFAPAGGSPRPTGSVRTATRSQRAASVPSTVRRSRA